MDDKGSESGKDNKDRGRIDTRLCTCVFVCVYIYEYVYCINVCVVCQTYYAHVCACAYVSYNIRGDVCTTKDLEKEEKEKDKAIAWEVTLSALYGTCFFFLHQLSLETTMSRARALSLEKVLSTEKTSRFSRFYFFLRTTHEENARSASFRYRARKGHFNRSEQGKRDSKRGKERSTPAK